MSERCICLISSRTGPSARPKQDSSHGQSRTLTYCITFTHPIFQIFVFFLSGPNYLFKNKACISDVAHSSPQFAQGACVYAQIHEKLEGTLIHTSSNFVHLTELQKCESIPAAFVRPEATKTH